MNLTFSVRSHKARGSDKTLTWTVGLDKESGAPSLTSRQLTSIREPIIKLQGHEEAKNVVTKRVKNGTKA